MPLASLSRKDVVFQVIVREYCRTAEPVGSLVVTELLARRGVRVSPATIRNDMAELESEGLIAHPHTSAGRVPTEKGYRDYVTRFTEVGQTVSARVRNALEKARVEVMRERESALRELARRVADLTQQTVVVRFDGQGFTYGVGNLLRKPEFQERAQLTELAATVDRLDEIAAKLEIEMAREDNGFGDVARRDDVRVMIGEENPFGAGLGSVITRVQGEGFEDGTIGIIGPMRMNYDETVALMNYLRRFFSR